MTPEGLIVRASRREPKETMDRLAAAVTAGGAAVVARIDHAAAAAVVGLALPPTEVLVFGNPRAGTLLMQAAQTIGIDLPLKALVWRDASGATFVGYNDPHWLSRRHGVEAGNEPVLKAMADFLAAVADEAAA
jgi:uncharacterized protein (DUF302 family)